MIKIERQRSMDCYAYYISYATLVSYVAFVISVTLQAYFQQILAENYCFEDKHCNFLMKSAKNMPAH